MLVFTLTVLSGGGLVAAAPASAGSVSGYGSVVPSPGARTVPYFSSSFTYGGVTYSYSMVGTDPSTTRTTTVVPTVIVPLRFVFADGHISDPGDVVPDALASPLFQPASFTTGVTQYGDAIRRAMFWQEVAASNYHVLLSPPLVLPTQTLKVPAAQGVYLEAGAAIGPPALGFHAAADTGVVSLTWFGNEQIAGAFGQLLARLNVDPRAVVIVVSRNAALSTDPVPYGAPVLGFHTTATSVVGGVQKIQTAMWADYAEPYSVKEAPQITQNADILSHEVSEWLHDPFVSNAVPHWISPLPLASLFYGCSSLLETGDPASDIGFQVNGYQLQDEAFLSWFSRQTPSIGINGWYSYLGTFTQPSPSC